MITDVYLVYNDNSIISQIGGTYKLKVSPFFHFIDERTRKGKKDAFKLKAQYAAKLTPFAVCLEGDTPKKAFYSETDDVIKNLVSYLNGEENLYS